MFKKIKSRKGGGGKWHFGKRVTFLTPIIAIGLKPMTLLGGNYNTVWKRATTKTRWLKETVTMLWNLGRKRKGDPFVWVKYEYLFSKTYPSHPLGRFPFFWDVWSSKKLITVSSLVLWIRCIICRSLFFVFPFPNHPPPTTQKIPPVSMCLYNPRWIPSIPSSQVPTLRLVLSTPLGCCNLPLLLSLSAANRSHRWQLSCRPPWRASEVVEVATWKPVYF